VDLHDLSARALGGLLERGEVSSEESVRAALRRMEAVEPRIHAFLKVTGKEALRDARSVDAARRRGEPLGPLAGVPIAVKDNLCTRGVQTTCGSRMLQDFIPPYDATAVEKVRKAHLVIIGKTNMDEFAMGSSTENSAFGSTANPWDLSRVPGGSSGGAAAAVAARAVPLALGSDTGGSVRQPAALTGVVGLKPTYGRVSRYGLVAFASSLDQVGVLGREVRDCAGLCRIISGHDPRDSTSSRAPVPDFEADLDGNLTGLRIGVPKEYFGSALDPEVETAVREALRTLEGEGAVCQEVEIPLLEYAVAIYQVLASAEASSNLARYDGVVYGRRAGRFSNLEDMYVRTRSEGFGSEVKRRIMLGTFALSSGYADAYYRQADRARRMLERDVQRVLERVDVLAGPTSPTAAFRIGEKAEDPLAMYLMDTYTLPANLAGIPALSLPCGFTSKGLPVGFQILGKPFDEAGVLRVGRAYERASPWRARGPSLGS